MRGAQPSIRELEAALDLMVRHFLVLSGAEDSDMTVANRILDAEAHALRLLDRHVFVRYVARRVYRQRTGPTPQNQLPIPGIHLPRIVSVPKPEGREVERVPLRDATLPQLIRLREKFVRENDQRLAEVDKAIAIHRKYGKRSRKVTLGELVEKYGQEIMDLQPERTT